MTWRWAERSPITEAQPTQYRSYVLYKATEATGKGIEQLNQKSDWEFPFLLVHGGDVSRHGDLVGSHESPSPYQ
jgi:hypothetical protein